MRTYDNEEIGKIVIIKNIIFENSVTNKKESDHAWKFGRPCLIIYSDDEYDYFLTLRTEIKYPRYKRQFYELTENDLLYKNKYRHNIYRAKTGRKKIFNSNVNLETVFKLPISGHDEVAKIKFDTYKDLIQEFEIFHKNKPIEEIMKKAKTLEK